MLVERGLSRSGVQTGEHANIFGLRNMNMTVSGSLRRGFSPVKKQHCKQSAQKEVVPS
jgi:hypothetical protein